MTEHDWVFEKAEFPTIDAELTGFYINNINNKRYFAASRKAKKVEFRVESFDTESLFDKLVIGAGSPQQYWGTIAPGTWIGSTTAGNNLNWNPVELKFVTDGSVVRPGFKINKVRVCCEGPASNVPFSLNTFSVTSGLLQGDNDTVEFTFPVRSDSARTNVALWGASTVDADLFVRCDLAPTPTSWNYRAISRNTSEFLQLDNAQCAGSGRRWFITVNSSKGSGRFDIMASPTYAKSRWENLTVGANFYLNVGEIQAISAMLIKAAKQTYGQTEGQILLKNFEFRNTGSCDCGGGVQCDICFSTEPGTGYVDSTGKLVIQWTFWSTQDFEGIAHEFGHKYVGVADEYIAGNPPGFQCGHSNMSRAHGTVTVHRDQRNA